MSEKASVTAIVNEKGGVGKSTASVNVAASLALSGQRVLLIDLDAVASASGYLGVKRQAKRRRKILSLALRKEKCLDDVIVSTLISPNLKVIAGDMALNEVKTSMSNSAASPHILKKILNKSSILESFDHVILDVHGSIDLLFEMAIIAADNYVVPTFPEADAFDGLEHMFCSIESLKDTCNEKLFFAGLVVTKFDKCSTHVKFDEVIRKFCCDARYTYLGRIPYSTAISGSSANSKPLAMYKTHQRIPARDAYRQLAVAIQESIESSNTEQETPSVDEETPELIDSIFSVEEEYAL